jgi:hypothetical protein
MCSWTIRGRGEAYLAVCCALRPASHTSRQPPPPHTHTRSPRVSHAPLHSNPATHTHTPLPTPQVLGGIAWLCPESVAWLLSHHAILRLLDVFLGPLSPLAPRGAARSSLDDDASSHPTWTFLLHTLAVLVCHSETEGITASLAEEDQLQDQLEWAEERLALLAAAEQSGTPASPGTAPSCFVSAALSPLPIHCWLGGTLLPAQSLVCLGDGEVAR